MTTHVGLSRPLIPRLIALLSARTFPYIACAEAVHEEGVEMTSAAHGDRKAIVWGVNARTIRHRKSS